MNATAFTVYRGQRQTLFPALTPCVSSQSPQTILRSPVPTIPMWARLTTVASQLASRSLGYVNNCASRHLPHLGATSQRACVSYAVHQVGMELQSPVASTNCATPFHDIRHYTGCHTFPTPFGGSRPTSGARHRQAHSCSTSPQLGNEINFSRGHHGDWTCELFAESLTDSAI